ncbi:MAG TPA: adenylate/guanylate cyclase domain-containing protein [Candidatus Binatia bacterium]|jgi:class 3 adenylate cyclase
MKALDLRDEIRPPKPYTPIKDLTRFVREKIGRQFDEIGRISRLKRSISPQIVEAVLNGEDGELLESHRREITVVFLDLRGFTAFSDVAGPEDALQLLRVYHAEMGRLIFKFKGTIERFAGDGIMVFFNDPIPCPDHRQRAVRMALEMHVCMKPLRSEWLKNGWDLDLGVGLAAAYAALGNVGFAERMDYSGVGTVTNLASRLCEKAKGGQILTNQKTLSEIDGFVDAEPMGELNLRGFARPVAAFNVTKLRRREANA